MQFSGEYQLLQKSGRIFTLALTVLNILRCDIFYTKNWCKGHLQRSHSMANIKVYKSHNNSFLLSLTFLQILAFQIVWPWQYRSRSRCTTIAVAPFYVKCMTSYPMAISNVCSIAHHLRDIRNQIKFPKFDLENEGRCQGVDKRNLHRSIGNVRFYIGEFFRILATWQVVSIRLRKNYTHRHNIQREPGVLKYRQNLPSRFG